MAVEAQERPGWAGMIAADTSPTAGTVAGLVDVRTRHGAWEE
ncbi:hypothetical protein GFS60_07545 (plasmid) [Rhodococcus sp. WAY2]|nr:hypothetical protein GFS60_06270 [Rhodococcus sp. WAY2]QHE73874.1 hypothetical protein GFS60_07545 [Rhodococcus sp. WAY2]